MKFHIQELKRRELEQRLKNAFPERWSSLTEGEKKIAVDGFYKKVWIDKITAEEALTNIRNKGITFSMLFLGVVIAILGGLVVDIIDRWLNVYGIWYQVLTPALFFILLWRLSKEFEKSINDEYILSDFLEGLLRQ